MNRVAFILLFSVIFTALSFAGQPASTPDPRKPMTLDSFAQATINVVREDGIAEYLPTIVLTDIQEFRVVEGIPATVDHRTAVQNVIRRSGYDSKEFYFGVRSAPDQITIGHYRPGEPTVFMTISKAGSDYAVKPLGTCDWWAIP